MTELELVRHLAVMSRSTHAQVRAVFDALSDCARDVLATGTRLPVPGLGALVRVERKARRIRNLDGSELELGPQRTVKLRTDGHLRPKPTKRSTKGSR